MEGQPFRKNDIEFAASKLNIDLDEESDDYLQSQTGHYALASEMIYYQ
jgi:hypothetical protein